MTNISYNLESLMNEEFDENDEQDKSFVFETEEEQDEKLRRTLVPEGYETVFQTIETSSDIKILADENIMEDDEEDQDFEMEEEEEDEEDEDELSENEELEEKEEKLE